MGNDNKEILEKLYAQQKELVKRLVAIRDAIIGFGGHTSNTDYQDLLEVEEHFEMPKLQAPVAFTDDLSRIHKIAFVIKLLNGEASSSEIADKLMELEKMTDINDEEKVKFRRNVALLISYLYRDNRLIVRKDGKYKYRLPD
jgi:hypothetical protein